MLRTQSCYRRYTASIGLLFLPVVLILSLSNLPRAHAQSRFEFLLQANPDILPANGVATSTISVIVPPGLPVPEGSTVSFFTSAGTIDPIARLSGRQARVRLRAGTQPALAQVTAVIGGFNRVSTLVEFTNEPVHIRFGPRLLIARGDSLVFSPHLMLIVAKGKSEFQFGNLTITSTNKVEYNINSGYLFAEGAPGDTGVTIASTGKQVRGDRLVYHLGRYEGRMERTESPPRIFLKGVSLIEVTEDPGTLNVPPNQYEFTGPWISAQQMIIRGNERIMMQQPSFFINGKKLYKLPYHVAPLPGFQPNQIGSRVGTSDALGFNSEGGLTVDLPLYYRANTSGSGAIHLRHIGGGGFTADQPGWGIALQDDYYSGDRGQGTIVLDRIVRRDWGFSAIHNHIFGRGLQANFFVDSPFHRDLFSQQTFYKDLRGYSLTVQSSQSLIQGGGDALGLQAFVQSTPRVLGKTGMTYLLAGSFTGNHFEGLGTGFARQEAVNLVLFPRAMNLSGSTSLQSSFRAEFGHATGFGAGTGQGATITLQQAIGSFGTSFSLNLDRAFGAIGTTKSLSMTMNGRAGKLHMLAFGTRDLSGNSTFASLLTTYVLGKRWLIRSDSAHIQFGPVKDLDHELSLGYILGQHEIGLTWSKSRRRIFLQVGSARF